MKSVLMWERRRVLEQTELEQIIPVEMIEFTSPGRWHEVLNHIQGHKYFLNMEIEEEIAFEDAARSWYNALYLPIIEIIREENLISRFPNRTEADLYIWIIKHWHSLKEKYGQDYPLDQAASEYAATHGRGFFQRHFKRLKRLLKNRLLKGSRDQAGIPATHRPGSSMLPTIRLHLNRGTCRPLRSKY
jgi:hypothetical protein